MTKAQARDLFGGRWVDLARAVGLTRQAINSWPDVLRPPHIDRVQAALYRRQHAAAQPVAVEAAAP